MNKVWKESLLEREKIENEQKDLLYIIIILLLYYSLSFLK